ncbi:hypothetical protein BDZ89DRAFT_741157 [Hymenopellis radicata]|nr:hypothetical protein BDZ89DRAFT_741157 [Hymenopellis radicata]
MLQVCKCRLSRLESMNTDTIRYFHAITTQLVTCQRNNEPSSFVPESTSHRILSFFSITNRKRTVWKTDSLSRSLRDRLWTHIAKDYEEAQKELWVLDPTTDGSERKQDSQHQADCSRLADRGGSTKSPCSKEISLVPFWK